MTKEQRRAFVVPSPKHAPKHGGLYSHDHHVVRVRDKDANLLEEHEAVGDTPQVAAEWALNKGYEVFILKEKLARDGVKPDPKDPSQWDSFKEADRLEHHRKTLKDVS